MSTMDAFYGQMTAYNLTGLNPGRASGAPAAAPLSSHSAGDMGAVPWHPDSHTFWLLAIGVGTVIGIIGASVNLRAGPIKAGGSLGKA